MSTRLIAKDAGMGVSFIVSAVIHLTVFLLVVWRGGLMAPLKIQETYYVDIVNLPVAAPQAGSPSQKGNDAQPAPPKTPTPPMALPKPPATSTKPKVAAQQKAPAKVKDTAVDQDREQAERMAKLERNAEDRQEEATMARLREKIKNQGSGRPGMPNGNGKEVGSSYEAYIKSRLIDAFREKISYNSKNPKMVVRLYIDSNGKLTRKKTESSSGDTAFEISVLSAIDLASEKFPPPPNHKLFELGVIFNREGVTPNLR